VDCEDPYPFLPDNVFAVHSRLFYEIFTLDINKEGVSPTDFIKVYGDGFKEGLQFLEREKIDIDQLDDENKKANLIKRLKRILYERKDKSGRTILNFGFSTPMIWTEKSIFQAGKHNGMITAIDQFAERAGLDEKDLKNEPQPKTEKKNTLWFKTGLLFAKGIMEKYYSDNGRTKSDKYRAREIADEVNLPKGEKYILATLQGYKSDKDIYHNRDKMLFIIEYCNNKGIEPHQSFLDKLPTEKM